MKKLIIVILSILLLCIAGYLSYKYMLPELKKASDLKIVKNINNKSDLEYNLLISYNDVDFDKLKKTHEYIQNYMSDDFVTEDIFISFSGYPNDESDFYLTRIELTSDRYNLLGIKVGDEIDFAETVLGENDFSEGEDNFEYENKNVFIYLTVNENIIEEISVRVGTVYLGNRIY